ncbi:MAG: 16S rRNA (adenine(1518)-N(6)/adenine(1519)-N(6))-dimethyltransferase RsmA [bacterium]|nr:16S rRNA (adenine(1518)-N(6)/adenine(1519)-N(6))-dimethyltransferase RsmA [bacterium]
MDLTSPQTIKELLKKHGAFASKGLGQYFLIDKGPLKDAIEAADLRSDDTVLEIGPGIGTLTYELAQRAKKVVSVEKDAKMVGILKETLAGFKNVEVINGDALEAEELGLEKFKVISNLPYYITSPVIRQFLEAKNRPQAMVLMVQKEVAQRICAKPPEMSLLAISVQFYAKPEIIKYVPKSCFWPQPKVDGAIIKIIPFTEEKTALVPLFFKIVRTGFSHPRKQLINNFCTGFGTGRPQTQAWMAKSGIGSSQRAETLSVGDWILLAKNYTMGQ